METKAESEGQRCGAWTIPPTGALGVALLVVALLGDPVLGCQPPRPAMVPDGPGGAAWWEEDGGDVSVAEEGGGGAVDAAGHPTSLMDGSHEEPEASTRESERSPNATEGLDAGGGGVPRNEGRAPKRGKPPLR